MKVWIDQVTRGIAVGFLCWTLVVLPCCKTIDKAKLAEGNTSGNPRLKWLTEINTLSQRALAGGAITSAMSLVSKNTKGLSEEFDEFLNAAPDQSAKRIGLVLKARTLRDLNDRSYPKSIENISQTYPMCEYALPCISTLLDIADTMELDPKEFREILSDQSPLKFSIERIKDREFVKDIVRIQFAIVQELYRLFDTYGGTLHNPVAFGDPYTVGPDLVREILRTRNNLVTIATQKIKPMLVQNGSALSDEQFIEKAIGKPLADVSNETTKKRIIDAVPRLHQHLLQAYEAAFQFAYFAQRLTLPSDRLTTELIRAPVEQLITGQAMNWEIERRKLSFARAVSFDSNRESTLPTRKPWLTVLSEATSAVGTPEWTQVYKYGAGMINANEALIKSFVDTDPYLKGSNILSVLNNRELSMSRSVPFFKSVFYRVMNYKQRQAAAGSFLAAQGDIDPNNLAAVDNRAHAIDDVHESYVKLVCFSKALETGGSIASSMSQFKLAPPMECPAPDGFDQKYGTYLKSKLPNGSGCHSAIVALQCPNLPAEQYSDAAVANHVHNRRIEVIWAPVIRQAIVVAAVAVSLVATMGVSAAAAAGYLGSTVAGIINVGASASLYARAGAQILNGVIGGVGFTVINNVVLLSTGIKNFDDPRAFAIGFVREAVVGSILMTLMPFADPLILGAGKVASSAVGRLTINQTAKELASKSTMAGIDMAVFLPVPYLQTIAFGYLDGKSKSEISKELSNISLYEQIFSGFLFSMGMQLRRAQLYDDYQFSIDPVTLDSLPALQPVGN